MAPVHDNVGVQGFHGHQQRGRATGEGQCLAIPGHYARGLGTNRQQSFLEPQCRSMILVIVLIDTELAVTQGTIQGDGAVVVGAHFQSQRQTILLQCRVLAGLHQQPCDSLAAHVDVHGKRVNPAQRSPAVKQHQHIAGQCLFFGFGDDQCAMTALEHPAKLAPTDAIFAETPLFQAEQCRQVVQGCGT